jgi:hypothetical protein
LGRTLNCDKIQCANMNEYLYIFEEKNKHRTLNIEH